jgi:PilZ domain
MQRLNELDIVTINLPHAARALRLRDFECLVVGLAPWAALLQPLEDAEQPLPERVEHVLLTFVHRGRLVGLKGMLTRPDGAGFLRFAVEDGVQVQRRRATRVSAELPITLRRDGDAAAHAGVTVNVALDGVLAAVDAQVDAGDRVELTLELPAPHSPVRVRGRVVRHGDGLVALELVSVAADVRTGIGRFVTAQVMRDRAPLGVQ